MLEKLVLYDIKVWFRVVMNFSCNINWRKCIHFNKNGCFDDGNNESPKILLLNCCEWKLF